MKLKKLSAVALSAIMATTIMVPFSAFATQTPSVDYTGGDGQPITKLTLIANDADLVTNYRPEDGENSPKLTAKIEVPVAINYVAQADGTIAGPSNNQAQIRNYAGFAVHVSNMYVESENGATLVSTSADADGADEIYLQMQPDNGTIISLGDFTATATASASDLSDGTGKKPTQGEWNIAAVQSNANTASAVASVLNLNSLTGKIGSFSTLHLDARTEIGQISWQVAPGTEQASRVTKNTSLRGNFVVAASAVGGADEVVEPGETAYIVATPETGYVADEMTVEKVSDNTEVTVTRDANNANVGSFVMPDDEVEVTVTFEEESSVPVLPNSAASLSQLSVSALHNASEYIRGEGKNDTEYMTALENLLGGTITVQLNSNTTMTARFVDIDTDRGLTFESLTLLRRDPINLVNSNSCGWVNCDLRKSMNQTTYTNSNNESVSNGIYATFFEGTEFDRYVLAVDNTSYSYGGGTNLAENDRYWLASADNLFGPNWPACYNEYGSYTDGQSQFDYYAAQRVKTHDINAILVKTDGTTGYWWMRSAYPNDPRSFMQVGDNGEIYLADVAVNDLIGVAPCFCL